MAPVTLCALLWAAPGRHDGLAFYEDRVLAALPDHGGRVLSRVRSFGDGPHEVQLLEFPSEEALAAYMEDPGRAALAAERDRVIARTEVLRVEVIGEPPDAA